MTKKHIAIQNPENVCFNCLQEGEVSKIHIPELGYGSSFDGWSTKIHLCENCLKQTNPEWWKLEIIYDGEHNYIESYKYEDEILEFVSQMPVEGKELFWNRYSTDDYLMKSQDWIDYDLDILSHEKCKEYGIYSPQEKQAYKDRFPNCKNVQIKVYGDGSKGSNCFKNAFGDDNGNCGLNISSKCYLCEHYEERDGKIKVVDVLEEYYKREIKRLLNMIDYANNRLEKIKNKTLSMDV